MYSTMYKLMSGTYYLPVALNAVFVAGEEEARSSQNTRINRSMGRIKLER